MEQQGIRENDELRRNTIEYCWGMRTGGCGAQKKVGRVGSDWSKPEVGRTTFQASLYGVFGDPEHSTLCTKVFHNYSGRLTTYVDMDRGLWSMDRRSYTIYL